MFIKYMQSQESKQNKDTFGMYVYYPLNSLLPAGPTKTVQEK